uniref:Surface antigen protein n=1 Tax=Acetithermum autotrophicum TaxID=1446466 RepID=H5SRM8_ACEAU|nr:surface antigen gene [Candidatus Acetothermum autotrophicum]
MMRLIVIGGLLVLCGLLAGAGEQPPSTAPEIVFIDFPKQIQADGTKVPGFVGFKDPDGNLARADFSIVQAKDLQPFTVDLKHLKGVKEGVFEFQIATQTPQQATLRVILVDEAGNHSQPKEFSFEAVGLGQPPPLAQPPVLQVNPTSLNFRGQESGGNPLPQMVKISNEGGSPLEWVAQIDVNWISLSATHGSLAPKESWQLQVAVNVAGLRAGIHQARITITAPGAQGSPAIVSVSLELVSANRAPVIESLAPQRIPWGKTLSVRVQASDPDVGDTITLEATNLPKNANFQTVRGNPAVGTFTFTPEAAQARQTFRVTFVATDTQGLRDSKELSVTVEIRPIQPRVIANVFLTSRPSGIAITPDNRRAYVANLNSNNVIVVDIQTARAGEIIQVGRRPLGVAISPDGRFVYVANVNDNNLSVIDTQINKVIKQIPVGKAPYGVTVTADGAKIYVSNLNSNTISIIDAHTLEVIGEIQVEAPSAMVISPDGRYAYVASYDVVVVDLRARRVIDTIKVKQPWEPQSPPWPWRLAITPDGQLVYATIQHPQFPNEDTVMAIDAQQRRVLAKVKTGNRPFGIAVTPDGGFVLVANQDMNNVTVVEVATNRVTQTIQDPLLTAQPLEVAISPNGHKALITNGTNSVTIVELLGE